MDAIEFVQSTVSALAKDTATVTPHIDETPGWEGVVLNVKVGGDIATVIGKQGKTIEAIRVVAKALGYEGSHRIKVNINEPNKPRD